MKKVELKNGKILTVREGIKEDAKDLISFVNNVAGESDYLTFGEGEFNITVENEEKILEDYEKEKNKIFIIAEIDGEVVSMLNYTAGKRERVKHTGEFGISVKKDYWGLGIGKLMMENMIEWAKNTGIIRKINLRVRSDNERGIGLYTSLGFKKQGLITRDMIIDGHFYDSISMGLEID